MGIIYELNRYSEDKNANSSLHVAELLRQYSGTAECDKAKKKKLQKTVLSSKKHSA